MKTQIFKTYTDFLKRENKEINGVSELFATNNPDFELKNKTNKGCWCCYGCYDCYGCYGKKGKNKIIKVPVIKDLNKSILSAVTSKGSSLEMGDWHTCDTTHCWAGWIVNLAGESGAKLEEQTSTEFAAMQIFKESNGYAISPINFYLSNDKAMAKIQEFEQKR